MVLLQPNPPWHHTILDQKLIDRLIDALPRVMVDSQVAHYCGINPNRLYDWIKFGKRDMDAGIHNSIYADFYQQYFEAKARVLEKKLSHLSKCPKNYGAITWIIERAFRDDFETKSDAQKQLEDYVFNVIQPMIGKGVIPHDNQAQKMDPESHQTSGCAP